MNQQATLSASLLAKFPVLEKIRALPKPILLGAAAALVALIVAVAMWSSEPQYKVLFSNLDDRDGGAIVTALGAMNVPYKYNDTGTALLVPADRVYDARLQLASQGLPRGGSVGFELMDNARFGASQFAEQINYQRGLEGELSRSIESMHTVQHARVHLAMPRQSLFVRERQAPTASVLLNVYPGRSLSDAQVSAISWLVASSVPELTAENVSIVDQNGRLLSAPTGEGRGMDADQMRMVRETEQRTVERILTILNPLVGPGNVHAQASAEMDCSRREDTPEVSRPNQEPGPAAIDDGGQIVRIAADDVLRVVQRQGLVPGNQCGGKQRRAGGFDQGERHPVVGHADADGLARGVRDAPGDFFRGFEDEGPGARRGQLQQPVLGIVDLGEVADFRQVAAQHRQVVAFVQAAQPAQAPGGVLVVQARHDGVAGIGGDGDQPSLGEELAGLLEQPGLRVFGMDDEDLCHEHSLWEGSGHPGSGPAGEPDPGRPR